MKEQKVVFLVEDVITKRDYNRAGATFLESLGHQVEVWQIILGKPVVFDYGELKYKGDNYRQFNKNEFIHIVKSNRDAIYITGRLYDFTHWILCKYNCKFIVTEGFLATIGNSNDLISDSLLKRIKRTIGKVIKKRRLKDNFRIIKELCQRRWYRFRCKSSQKSPVTIITGTHYLASVRIPKEELKGNVLYIHAKDYDYYIETQRIDSKQREKHILYCDSAFVDEDYHVAKAGHDMMSEEYNVYVHREEYFQQIETLFQKLEDYYGVPVVVAGHPHVIYKQGEFGGREIIREKTCELARDAKLFITNCSTAMSFAILYDKPILFIQNERFKKTRFSGATNAFSYIQYVAEEKLKVGFLNMSNSEEMERPWEKVRKFPRREREEFMREYIIDTDKTKKTITEYIAEILQEL